MSKKIIALLLLLVAALTGCSQTGGEPSAVPSATADSNPNDLPPAEPKGTHLEAPPLGTGAPTATEDPTHDLPDGPPAQAEYGEFGGLGFTYEDGLSITVTAPVAYEPSDTAFVDTTFENYLKFDVTLTNGSGEPFSPEAVYATMSSGGVEASQSFDTEQGLEGQPQTTILPGASVTWTEGWGVSDPADLVYEIAPGFEYDSALFVGGMP